MIHAPGRHTKFIMQKLTTDQNRGEVTQWPGLNSDVKVWKFCTNWPFYSGLVSPLPPEFSKFLLTCIRSLSHRHFPTTPWPSLTANENGGQLVFGKLSNDNEGKYCIARLWNAYQRVVLRRLRLPRAAASQFFGKTKNTKTNGVSDARLFSDAMLADAHKLS